MANERIIDLNAQTTPHDTDLYENSLNGTGSQKETRLQMRTAMEAVFDTRYLVGGPLTTKGDLLVNNGTANVRLGVGADGTVLESNSTAADGIDWTPTLNDAALNPSVAYQARTLLYSSGNISINWGSAIAIAPGGGGNPSINWNARILYDGIASSFAPSVAWGLRLLYDPSTVVSLSWIARSLYDSSAALSMNWNTRLLYADDGSTIVLDYSQPQTVRIGDAAGISSSTGAIAVGFEAGNTSQSSGAIAIGTASGLTDQGSNAIAIGVNAGNANQSGSSIALGLAAGASSQGSDAIAIGISAGAGTQGANAIAIGTGAGATSQGANSIAIGNSASGSTQPADTVSIGTSSSVTGANSTAIGYNARDNGFNNSIALGNGATNTAVDQAILPSGVFWSLSSLSQQLNNVRTSPQVTVGLGVSRQPNLSHDTEITFSVTMTNTVGQSSSVSLQISPDNSTWQTVGGQSSSQIQPSTSYYFNKIIQASYYYRCLNNSSTGTVAMSAVTELTL